MIIIGEKLNGSIPSCGKAIAAGDVEYIKDLAKRQADAGSDYIDCCASVDESEFETLLWMIDAIQSVTDCPISVDSPDVQIIIDAMKHCKSPGLFNSVSAEGDKIDRAFAVLSKPENEKWHIMALLCDDEGIPKTAAKRIEVFEMIMAKAAEYKIAANRIHVDPLIEMLCTTDDEEGIHLLFEVIAHIRNSPHNVYISGGFSNISYNLPARRLVNQAFAAIAVSMGVNSAVIDPLSKDLRGVIFAAQAMMGLDDLCVEYVAGYRQGIFS